MALSLLSSAIKTKAQEILDNVHETFGRTITAYKDAEENIIATTPEYNSIYKSAGASTTSISKSVVSSTFQARIKKYSKITEEFLQDGQIDSQLKITLPKGTVRIKVDPSGFNFIKKSKRVELDGVRYTILNDASPRIIGPFDAQYYAFYLIPIDQDDAG